MLFRPHPLGVTDYACPLTTPPCAFPCTPVFRDVAICLRQPGFPDVGRRRNAKAYKQRLVTQTMGLLFTKLMTIFGDREHKVILVGLDNAGKTTILYQFLTKEAVHTSPTIGSNVEEISVRNTRFLVWDISGQENLRATWSAYYCNTEIVILVVDSTDRERLTLTKEELHRMLAHEELQNAAVLILANKQDMKNSMTASEISSCLTLSSITGHSWHIQACCALTGEGLLASLDWMRSRVLAS